MSAQCVVEQLVKNSGITQHNSTELYPALHQPGDKGLPMLVVENALGRAVIAPHGAHLMAFKATGQREMLWVSPKTALEAGTPIRGGIPLCLPWFGPGPDGKAMHGFARTMNWTVLAAEQLDCGATRLVLGLDGDASVSALWPHAFAFRLEVTVGSELKLKMTVRNRGSETAPLAFAFHTYFAVPDVAQAGVTGLEGATYIDKMDNFTRKTQQGEVTISAVTDRIYLDVPPEQTLYTAAGATQIASDCSCCIVWNAWDNDRNIADLGTDNHRGYLCVEPGDVADHAVTLPPGETYCRTMTLSAV